MKIAIIGGAGNVGASLAFTLVNQNLCDEIVLNDLNYKRACGLALDLSQSAYSLKSNINVTANESIEDFKNIDIVVVTAGLPRLHGMSRSDLVEKNSAIIEDIFTKLMNTDFKGVAIIVTNPLDAMVYKALKITRWNRNRIIGMGTQLDSSRMAYYIAQVSNKPINEIEALVIGSHGNKMLPLPNHSKINGIKIIEILKEKEIDKIVEDTKNGGATIVKLFGNGSAYYAPATSVAVMLKAIINDTKEIIPCCVMLENEYSQNNITSGVVASLGRNGIIKIIEIELNEKEKELFNNSVMDTQDLV